jgi:hypothetical protein
MKPWVWFIAKRGLKSLKQSRITTIVLRSNRKKKKNKKKKMMKLEITPPAAQRREPLQRLEQGYPKEQGLVSAGKYLNLRHILM